MSSVNAGIDIRNANVFARNRQIAVSCRDLQIADEAFDARDRAAFSIEQLESTVGVKRADAGFGLQRVELRAVDLCQHDRQLRQISTASDTERSKHCKVGRRRLMIERNYHRYQA